jgi:hypothetical protein
MKWLSHAMHPRVYCCDYLRVGLPARTLSSQGLARLVPTLTDGTLQSSPPDSDPRHFESAPYAGPTYPRRSYASVYHDRHFGVGRHRALPEVG